MTIIEKQLKNFIRKLEANVYALRGSWGVGKTFLWEKVFNNPNNNLAYEKYSYVSLFGINSLAALKSAIFENTIKTETVVNKNTNKKERKISIPIRKASKFIPQLPYLKEISAPFDYITFNSIKDTLICLDDIERRSDLEIKEIFGLCNYLKEKKGCKIIIILNDDEISNSEEKIIEYKKYREKIIDVDLLLKPTPKECNKIVFGTKKANLQNNCELLNITNIRILKKIDKMHDEILKCKNDIHKDIIEQIENTLPLFMYCFYSGSDIIPSLDYVTNNKFIEDIEIIDDIEDKAKRKIWNSFINSGNYQFTDKLDLIIAQSVKQGFVNKDELLKEIELKTNELNSQNINKAFQDALSKYKYSFDGNPDEIIQNIINTSKENIANIPRQNLDEVVRLLRNLNQKQVATELIDEWIEAHKETIGCFDLSENDLFPEVRDSEIILKFNDFFKKHYIDIEKSQNRIIEKITNQQGVDDTDLFILQNVPENELVKIIKSLKPHEIRIFIKFVLICKNLTDWKHNIYEHSINAFKVINNENELNKLRLKYWGIEFDE